MNGMNTSNTPQTEYVKTASGNKWPFKHYPFLPYYIHFICNALASPILILQTPDIETTFNADL
jgi:hypothetical protein